MLTIVIGKAQIRLIGDGTGGHWGDRVDCQKKKKDYGVLQPFSFYRQKSIIFLYGMCLLYVC